MPPYAVVCAWLFLKLLEDGLQGKFILLLREQFIHTQDETRRTGIVEVES